MQNYRLVLFKRVQMDRQDRTTQTDGQRHRYRIVNGLTLKNVLKLLSSLILPLTLGIFTMVITFHQQNTAREQRLEGRNELREQRLEDRNESREQRFQDRNESRKQREQDLHIAYIGMHPHPHPQELRIPVDWKSARCAFDINIDW